MLVIMDMEWSEAGGRIVPTQLSALRVLPGWKELARVDYLMRPIKTPDWSFMAYNGHSPDEFLSAHTGPSVFNRLSNWLSPNDIMCWWSPAPAITFFALHKVLLKQPPQNQIRTIIPSVEKAMAEKELLGHASIYDHRDALNLMAAGAEHCSADDVNLIREILEQLSVDETDILNNHLPPHSYDRPLWNIHKKTVAEHNTSQYTYIIDRTTNLIHTDACPKANWNHQIEVVHSMKKCLKHHLRPCACCKEIFWRYSYEDIKKKIESCHYNYIYSDSGLFHKPTCIHVRHIPSVELRGTVRYSTAVKHGNKPCGWCRPKPEDEVEPPHIYDYGRAPVEQDKADPSSFIDQGSGSPYARMQRAEARKKASYSATRALTDAELRAITRHKQAAQERASLPDNLVGVSDHDAHVLTQSGYAFWAAKGYRNFHLRQCPKLAHLSDLYGYATYADARKFGLTPCKTCKPTPKHDIIVSVPIYQQRRATETVEDLDFLCDEQSWEHSFSENEYVIETPVGKWKIIVGTSPVDVYHINKVKTPNNTNDYHRQHRLFLSMTDTIEYIKRHDWKLIGRTVDDIQDDVFDVELPAIGGSDLPENV